jgi:hypothetical protein
MKRGIIALAAAAGAVVGQFPSIAMALKNLSGSGGLAA